MSKNCLLIFRNKKLNSFSVAKSLLDIFAENGYYFDKVEFVTYDNSEEIARSLSLCSKNYENLVILCPSSMEETLRKYIGNLYGAEFDNFGVLNADSKSAYLLISDGASKLTVSETVKILNSKYRQAYGKAYIKAVAAPHDEVDSAINAAKAICPECDFIVTEKFSDCTIELVYPEDTPKWIFDSVFRTLLTALDKYVYAIEDVSLAERLFQLLKLRRMKISVAESFTGGGVAKRLVDISGISEVYFEGLNTYSNESKMLRLGVKELTLRQHGAVSEQTAYEMAEGLLNTGNCDVAIATTGIAGPKSDNTLKPVGLLFIAVGTKEHISVYKYELKGGRENITETAINLALFLAFKMVK